MKPLLLLVVIAFCPTLQQVGREEPDLLVVKFSWAKEKQNSPVSGQVLEPDLDLLNQGLNFLLPAFQVLIQKLLESFRIVDGG